jgi:transcriptional regulator with XRE-family HTH domain
MPNIPNQKKIGGDTSRRGRHFGLSTIAAKNIRRIREQRGLSRESLAHLLNLGPSSPGDPPYGEEVKPWTDQRIVALEHGHKNRKPSLSVDDAFAVGRALKVPLYELLLPDSSNANYGVISTTVFGFELTDTTIAGLRRRSELHTRLRNHPEVTAATLEEEATWWQLYVQSSKEPDERRRDQLSEEALEVRSRAKEIARTKIESLIFRLHAGTVDEPTDADTERWSLDAYAQISEARIRSTREEK